MRVGGTLSTIAVAIPPMVVLVLGGRYLWRLTEVLLDPGVPVEFELKTRGGPVAVRLKRYRLDPKAGRARIDGLRVVAPGGSRVQVARIDLRGIDPLRPDRSRIVARGDGIDARLVRGEDGRFELERLLPEPSGEPSRIPYRVALRNTRLRIVDRTTGGSALASGSADVSGVGDDLLARADLRLDGAGRGRLTVAKRATGRVEIGVRATEWSASGLVALARGIPEVRRIREAERLRITGGLLTGDVAAAFSGGRPFVAEGRLRGRLDGVRWEDLPAVSTQFDLRFDRESVRGPVTAEIDDGRAEGRIAGRFGTGAVVRFDGAATLARVPDAFRDRLPKGLTVSGAGFRGSVLAGPGGPVARGLTTLDRIAFDGRRGENLRAEIRADGRIVRWDGLTGRAEGVPIRSDGMVALRDRAVIARAEGEGPIGSLLALAGRSPSEGSGRASGAAIAVGPLDRVRAEFRASADGTLVAAGRPVRVRDVRLAGGLRDGKVLLARASARPEGGAIAATGQLGDRVDVVVRGLDLGLVAAGLRGRADGEGSLTGPLTNPKFVGVAELRDAGRGDITSPFLRGDIVASRDGVRITDLFALRGAATGGGALAYRFSTGELTGRLNAVGLQLGDFTGGRVVGGLEVTGLTLAGTTARPVARAEFRLAQGAALGYRASGVAGQFELTGSRVRLSGAGEIAGGRLRANGELDLRTNAAAFTARLTDLDLSRLAAPFADVAALRGRASGSTAVRFRNGRPDGTVDLAIEDAFVNGSGLGSGAISAALRGDSLTATAQIGSPERYVELRNFAANLDRRRAQPLRYLEGEILASRFEIPTIARAVERYLPQGRFADDLRLSAGEVSFALGFSGEPNDAILRLDSFAGENLKYRELTLGNLVAKARRQDRVVTVDEFRLDGPLASRATFRGRIEENGQTTGEAEIAGFRPGSLGALLPGLGNVTGEADLTLALSGPTRGPRVDGTINGRRLFAPPESTDRSGLFADALFSLTDAGAGGKGLELDGNFAFNGFQGTVRGGAPVTYGDFARADLPVDFTVALASRPLKDIFTTATALDNEKTEGAVAGDLRLFGKLSDLDVTGNVEVRKARVALRDLSGVGRVETELRNGSARIALSRETARLSFGADSSLGGNVRGEASVSLGKLALVDATRPDALSDFLGRTLTGKIDLDRPRLRQGFEGGAFVDAIADGRIALGGTVGAPRISGTIEVPSLETIVPTFAPREGESAVLRIDPVFDLKFALTNPARVRASALEATILGGGAAVGPLSALRAEADLSLVNGRLRLPGGTVRLEPEGTLAFRYRPDVDASLRVDLEGRTAVSALDGLRNPTRYDVELTVRGDLLRTGDLGYVARTDPPGLDSNQVLSLLTRTDILSTVATATGPGGTGLTSTQNILRNALAGYALPLVLDPVTSGLSRALGLDYLTLDYDQFGRASVALGRSFLGGFSIIGRRQLTEPQPGFPEPFDIRINYRPRRLSGLLGNLNLFVGADEIRQWRIGVDYQVRLNTLGGNPRKPTRTVIVSSPDKP